MKCPKCGYLGFETTDRCRNCQYDFSLTPASSDPELSLRTEGNGVMADFEMPPISRPTDGAPASGLDLDRLFGDPEPPPAAAAPVSVAEAAETPSEAVDAATEVELPAAGAALPFDESPLLPPRAARTPLAVRRATPEIPRNRPRTTRPVRLEAPLVFEPAASVPLKSSEASALASDTVASLMQPPPLGARVGAGVIDLALLAVIDGAVLFLTLRIAGLQTTIEDLRVLPTVPFVAFLALLAFGYVASFTVAGGQTIGKMLLKLRVIGDDGRSIDAAGGVLRAAGCMLVPLTLGLSYVPALFTSDHRALHDRLAGTRVVSE